MGKGYTKDKNGQVTVRNKPSLISKVVFVKQNISTLGVKYGFDPNLTEFEGIIITMDYPPITEYNGIGMLSIHQIPRLK